jgi:uncharacterized OsmC-like protein
MQMERLQDGLAKAVQVSEKWTRIRTEVAMDIRSLQKPLKEQYRNDPNASQITIRAKGGQTDVPVACSVDLGRAIYQAEAHKGVGGSGSGACSGDLLLGALAACAQITCQMVAAAMGIPTERIEVTVEGDLDLRGTLGISKNVPVGFETIHLHFNVAAPRATGTTARIERENRTVLRGDADLNAAAESADRLGWSILKTEPRPGSRIKPDTAANAK